MKRNVSRGARLRPARAVRARESGLSADGAGGGDGDGEGDEGLFAGGGVGIGIGIGIGWLGSLGSGG